MLGSARLVQAEKIRCGGVRCPLRVLLAPLRAGAAHIVELGPVMVGHVADEPAQRLENPQHADAAIGKTPGQRELAHSPASAPNPGTPESLILAGDVHAQATLWALTRSARKAPANPVPDSSFPQGYGGSGLPGSGRAVGWIGAAL